MSIDGIGLEPIGESFGCKFVEHTALVDIEVVTNLVVSPVCQVPSIIINLWLALGFWLISI
jgi:hypothetical protein